MKKKKKKLNKRKFILVLLIPFSILLLNKWLVHFNIKYTSNFPNISHHSDYKTIKKDKNENYNGIGKQTVTKKDGYFSTFTTISNQKKTYLEYKQNGNSSWANHEYWGGTMAENGCGITALSIILSGYNKNYTPEQLRKKYYPVLAADKIATELSSTFGIKNSDFYYDTNHFSKEALTNHLKTNRPILICVWNKPSENRWTSISHYMVLLATDENDMVYISNPNRS